MVAPGPAAQARKSGDAFRTIGEVSDELGVAKHVLRFWELKFPQVRPMKRGGGRRFYRPEDLALLYGIRQLLHAEGYKIAGVQKILREQGVDAVKAVGRVAPADPTPTASGSQSPGGAKRSPSAKNNSGSAPANSVSAAQAMPMLRDAVELAISELEICRELLNGERPPGPAGQARDQQRGRAA